MAEFENKTYGSVGNAGLRGKSGCFAFSGESDVLVNRTTAFGTAVAAEFSPSSIAIETADSLPHSSGAV